jgi:hypothetical protein
MSVGGALWAFLVLALPLALHFYPATLIGALAAMLLTGALAPAALAKLASIKTQIGGGAENFGVRLRMSTASR